MRRREFISLIGGVAAWPLAVRAQQPERVRRVVFLHGLAEKDPEAQSRVAAFREELETLGWIENRNIKIENRFSGGDIASIQVHTAELGQRFRDSNHIRRPYRACRSRCERRGLR